MTSLRLVQVIVMGAVSSLGVAPVRVPDCDLEIHRLLEASSLVGLACPNHINIVAGKVASAQKSSGFREVKLALLSALQPINLLPASYPEAKRVQCLC